MALTREKANRERCRLPGSPDRSDACDLHTILTDNPVPSDCRRQAVEGGIQSADLPRHRDGWLARLRVHHFDQIRFEHGIGHRLTTLNHPWTNGQIGRMNRTSTDDAIERYHYYSSYDELRQHLQLFIDAHNHGRN